MAAYGGGCLGSFALILVIMAIWYGNTGFYQPRIPDPGPLPNPNAFNTYLAAARMFRANGGIRVIYPGGWRTRPVAAGERLAVSQNQPALKLFRQGLLQRCRMPAPRGMNDNMLYIPALHQFARLLSAEADVKIERADYAGAYSTGLDLLQYGEDIARGGVARNAWFSVSIQALAQRQFARSFERLTAAECDRFAVKFQALIQSRVPSEDILREERFYILSRMAKYRGPEVDYGYQDSDGPTAAALMARRLPGVYWHFSRDQAIRETDEFLTAFTVESRKPAAKRLPIRLPDSPAAAEVASWYPDLVLLADTCDARNRVALCALRIRAFHLHHGRLPDSLAQLGLPTDMTTDPFTGGPLVYRPSVTDYLLYSVGRDLRDDRGRPADVHPYSKNRATGDLGMAPYWSGRGVAYTPYYRHIPHMRAPMLATGARPLDQ